MPLMEEAKAVINELPRANLNSRAGVVANYAHQIAAQTRTDYRDDDETTTTRPWLVTVGGTDANPSVFTGPDSSSLAVADTTNVPTLSKGGQSIVIAAKTTRGAFRRFAAAIGVTLTGLG